MTSSPVAICQTDGENMETVSDFIFLGSKINAWSVTAAMKLRDACSLEQWLCQSSTVFYFVFIYFY